VQEEENDENGKEKKNISKFSQLLLNVSIYTNLMKIFSINKQEGQLDCLNGIRFLSMGWVVLGHVFFYFAGSNLIGIFIYIYSLILINFCLFFKPMILYLLNFLRIQ
jgi:hypothetical protein